MRTSSFGAGRSLCARRRSCWLSVVAAAVDLDWAVRKHLGLRVVSRVQVAPGERTSKPLDAGQFGVFFHRYGPRREVWVLATHLHDFRLLAARAEEARGFAGLLYSSPGNGFHAFLAPPAPLNQRVAVGVLGVLRDARPVRLVHVVADQLDHLLPALPDLTAG